MNLFFLWAGLAHARSPLLEMGLTRDAIYTPGAAYVSFALTDSALLEGPYRVRMTISVTDRVVHRAEFSVAPGRPATREMAFPPLRDITEARCRAELLKGDEFLEAHELPLSLWPRRDSLSVSPCDAEAWVLDPSGSLAEQLSAFGLSVSDAAFQAVRDLRTPDVIFLGQSLDDENMRAILTRIEMMPKAIRLIVLQQDRFTLDADASLAEETTSRGDVIYEPNSVLLAGLSSRDVMRLVDWARPVRIERESGESIHSYVACARRRQGDVLSYLCLVQENGRYVLYCQLPTTDAEDPRQMALLRNIVRFACNLDHSVASAAPVATERQTP